MMLVISRGEVVRENDRWNQQQIRNGHQVRFPLIDQKTAGHGACPFVQKTKKCLQVHQS